MKQSPKETPLDFKDFDEMSHKMDKLYLDMAKKILITSPSIILFYVIRVIFLIFFWIAGIYVFVSRMFIVTLVNDNLLLFLAIYMSVVFNTFYQTLDFFHQLVKEKQSYRRYKEVEEKYLKYEKEKKGKLN